jgi:hypothetical protein
LLHVARTTPRMRRRPARSTLRVFVPELSYPNLLDHFAMLIGQAVVAASMHADSDLIPGIARC